MMELDEHLEVGAVFIIVHQELNTNHGEINHGKIMGQSWENHGKIMGKSWENHGNIVAAGEFFGRFTQYFFGIIGAVMEFLCNLR
jgi:hypothetical protein